MKVETLGMVGILQIHFQVGVSVFKGRLTARR